MRSLMFYEISINYRFLFFSSRSEFRYLPTPHREREYTVVRVSFADGVDIFAPGASYACSGRINLPQITVVRGNNRAPSTNSFKQASQIAPSQTPRNQ